MKQNLYRIISLAIFLAGLDKADCNLSTTVSCPSLPPGCAFVEYSLFSNRKLNQTVNFIRHEIECENFDELDKWNELDEALTKCILLYTVELLIKPSERRQIVDERFGALTMNTTRQNLIIGVKFLDVKGFDIESAIDLGQLHTLSIYTPFNLYRNKEVVKNCHAFAFNSTTFIFRATDLHLEIVVPKRVNPICSLFFRDASIYVLTFKHVAESYFIKHKIWFVDSNETEEVLNSNIKLVYFNYGYGINVDSKLLNPLVFANTILVAFNCHINSIHENVFVNLKKVRRIHFQNDLIRVIRRQGIVWIKQINSNLNVDEITFESLMENIKRVVLIYLEENKDYEFIPFVHYALDEDFCLYVDYPFEQLVFFKTSITSTFWSNLKEASCTEWWIFKYSAELESIFNFGIQIPPEFSEAKNSTNCNFERRISLCNKTRFRFKDPNRSPTFSYLDFVVVSELFLIILTPLLGIFGLLANFGVIYVVFHKENKKTLRQKHYIYLCLHCASNIIILLTQILSPIHECQFVGLFCSSIRLQTAAQYIKMVSEFFNCMCRLSSNFSYLGFSLSRLTQVGKDHGQLIVFMDKLSIKKYMFVSIVMSTGLSVCRPLRMQVNLDQPELPAPLLFTQNIHTLKWFLYINYNVIVGFNVICDVINYLVFVLVHLIVDLVLAKKINLTINEKESKLKEIKKGPELDKSLKENEDSRQRVTFMVFFSSLLNFFTKLPSLITTLNDLRILVVSFVKKEAITMLNDVKTFSPINLLRVTFTLRYYCYLQRSCMLFQYFSNCLFLVSLMSVFSFIKHFDMNFKIGFQNVLPKYFKNSKKST